MSQSRSSRAVHAINSGTLILRNDEDIEVSIVVNVSTPKTRRVTPTVRILRPGKSYNASAEFSKSDLLASLDIPRGINAALSGFRVRVLDSASE